MASSTVLALVDSLPATPHQPQSFSYPKRAFGKKTIVSRSFQTQWYRSWSWLHNVEANDSVLFLVFKSHEREENETK